MDVDPNACETLGENVCVASGLASSSILHHSKKIKNKKLSPKNPHKATALYMPTL